MGPRANPYRWGQTRSIAILVTEVDATHNHNERSTQGHDLRGYAKLLGRDHGRSAEDTARECDAEGESRVEDSGQVLGAQGPIHGIFWVIGSIEFLDNLRVILVIAIRLSFMVLSTRLLRSFHAFLYIL